MENGTQRLGEEVESQLGDLHAVQVREVGVLGWSWVLGVREKGGQI